MEHRDDIDPRLQRTVRAALDTVADDIDTATRVRLRDARQRALAVAERRQRPHWRWQTMTLPAAAAVAIAVVAMTLLLDDGGFRRASQAVVAAPPEAVPDLDLLTSGENLELLDDLEFFRWLPPARRS